MSIRQQGTERERGERKGPGKYCSNLSVRGFFTLLEPGNGKAQARGKAGGLEEGNGGGEEEEKEEDGKGRRKATEPRNRHKKEAGMRGEGGLWMESEESESGKTV